MKTKHKKKSTPKVEQTSKPENCFNLFEFYNNGELKAIGVAPHHIIANDFEIIRRLRSRIKEDVRNCELIFEPPIKVTAIIKELRKMGYNMKRPLFRTNEVVDNSLLVDLLYTIENVTEPIVIASHFIQCYRANPDNTYWFQNLSDEYDSNMIGKIIWSLDEHKEFPEQKMLVELLNDILEYVKECEEDLNS